MQQWVFVSATGQQLSANEPEIPALVHSSQIGPQTLMWREGMVQWVPAASAFRELFAAAPAGGPGATQALTTGRTASEPLTPAGIGLTPPDPAAIRRLAAPLIARKGWIKLLGIFCIVIGVVSIPIGIILIFAGVALVKASGLLENARATGDPAALEGANKEMSTYFLLHGIIMVINVCLIGLFLVFFLVVGVGAGVGLLRGTSSRSPTPRASEAPLTSEDIRFPDSPAPGTP